MFSSVIPDAADAAQHAIHRTLNSLELGNTTLLALDVLTQGAERPEVHLAGVEGTFVYLGLVAGARQVPIKVAQRPEIIVTKNAFICSAIPGSFGCDVGCIVIVAGGEKTRRIGNDVVAI